MINKKAFLLGEETVKVIIAVICIGLLVVFVIYLYSAGKSRRGGEEFAEESLDYLIEQINAGATQIEIYNPKDWMITSWPYKNQQLDNCANLGYDYCICICPVPAGPAIKNIFSACNEKSICKESDFAVEGFGNSINISNPPLKLEIDYENKKITEKNE